MRKELERNLTEQQIDELLAKYQAKDLFEMVEIMICTTSRNCINLNYKDFIDEINQQLYSLSFENEILTKQNEEIRYLNKRYREELLNLARKSKELNELQKEIDKKSKQGESNIIDRKPAPFLGKDFKI